MKTKIILPFFLAIIILSFSAYALIDCSIVTDSDILNVHECAEPGKIVLRLSDLSDGGSHAGTALDSAFPKVVCCTGVPGLVADTVATDNFMGCLTGSDDGHMSKTGTQPPFPACLYLNAPTELTCAYIPDCLPSYETCLFSISGDSDAHVSTCDAAQGYVYPSKYCCRTGEATCIVTDKYWGIVVYYEEGGVPKARMEPLAEPPVCPVGKDMMVILIAETSGCEGTTAEFTIYNSTDTEYLSSANLHGTPIVMGTLNDAPWDYPNTVATIWEYAGEGNAGPPSSPGDYKFKVKLTSTDPVFTTTSTYSPEMEVSDSCSAKNPITPCATTITEAQIAQCTAECIGAEPTPCPDADCDNVADCIDDITTTPANCDDVGACSGIPAGTSGCIASMDCTINQYLTWSACKNCEAGELCDDKDPIKAGDQGPFNPGDQYMERCEGVGPEKCDCEWIGTPPSGCIDEPEDEIYGVLNQYNNRFKECIEEQEFPVFDGFNVVAVLLILSMYYAVIIIRKKK